MRILVIGSVLLLSLASCRFIPGTQEHDVEEAQKAVSFQLRDPDSAKFRGDREITFKGHKIVCGEVNGHNAVGAFDGFRPYFYDMEHRKPYILPSIDDLAAKKLRFDLSPQASACIEPNSPWWSAASGSADPSPGVR